MKDSEFLELLNLYVDHEISTEQAARLEAEVTASAERRKLYRQYCMLHKGCSLLSGSFVESAPAPVRQRDRAAESRSFWGWSGVFAAGGMLAAACVAMVVTLRIRSGQTPAASGLAAAEHTVPAVAVTHSVADAGGDDLKVVLAAQHPVNFPSPFGSGELQTVLNTRAWSNPALGPVPLSPNDPLAWLDQVKLAPIDHDGFQQIPISFKAVPMLLPTNPAALPVSLHETTEVSAFQFQK